MRKKFFLTAKKSEPLSNFLHREISHILQTENFDKNFSHEIFSSKQNANQISNAKIRRLLFSCAVSINSNICKNPNAVLKTGDTISFFFDSEKFFFEKKTLDIDFNFSERHILFEDEFLIAVDKPAFFPSDETFAKTRSNMKTLVRDYLLQKNEHAYLESVHRLDTLTSGVLVFAKEKNANAILHEAFKNHEVKKIYRAVCSGNENAQKEFAIENFIGKNKNGIWENVDSENGKYAKTFFRLLGEKMQNGSRRIFFEAEPETGRTHQIRIHLSIAGFPILGDEMYGGEKSTRLFLHANRLVFRHPLTKKMLDLVSRLPKEFEFK